MTLQSSGQINLSDIVDEFGDPTPSITKLSEFYGAGSNIPTSGTIKFSDFYGKRSWVDGYAKTATSSNANLLWVPTNELGINPIYSSSGGLDFLVAPTVKIVALTVRSYQATSGGEIGKIWFLDLDDLMQGIFTPVYDLVPSDVSSAGTSIIMTDITDTHFIIRQADPNNGNRASCFLYSYTYNATTQSFSATKLRVYARPSNDNYDGTSDWYGKIPRNDVILFQAQRSNNGAGRLYQYDFSGNQDQIYDPDDFDTGNYWSANLSYNKKYISVSDRLAFGNEKWRTMIFEYDSTGLVSEVINRVVGSNSYDPDGRLRQDERFLFFGDQLLVKDGGEDTFYDSGGQTWYGNNGLQLYDYEEFDTNGNLTYYKHFDSWPNTANRITNEKYLGHAYLGQAHEANPIVMSDEYVKNTKLIGTWGNIYSTPNKYYVQLYDFYNDSIHFYDVFDLHDFRSDITVTDFERYPVPQNIIAREEGILINVLLKDSATQSAYSGFGLAIPRN